MMKTYKAKIECSWIKIYFYDFGFVSHDHKVYKIMVWYENEPYFLEIEDKGKRTIEIIERIIRAINNRNTIVKSSFSDLIAVYLPPRNINEYLLRKTMSPLPNINMFVFRRDKRLLSLYIDLFNELLSENRCKKYGNVDHYIKKLLVKAF